MRRKLLRIVLWPVTTFFRWLGCPLEGGQAIDLDDPGEWMTADEWRAGPKNEQRTP